MRTPKTDDEIKKGLECCKDTHCKACPYFNVHRCAEENGIDALALIQKLQDDNAEKDQRIRQLEAERDAAVRDMTEIVQNSGDSYCEYCKNWKPGTCPPYCRTHSEGFRWRGVQKEK